MNEQDKSLLDEQAARVRAVYRALPDEEIPAQIEQRILANAASAIKPHNTRRWLQWSAPLASAAVVLLVVGVVMQPQSQREMVPESAVMVDLQLGESSQAGVAAPAQMEAAEPATRLPAEKPNLSAIPPPLTDAPVRSSAPAPKTEPAPSITALTTSPIVAEKSKREEPVSSAFEPPAVLAEERKGVEEDLLTRASGVEAADAAGGADPIVAGARVFSKESARSALMRAAPPAAAPLGVNVTNPALNISPELRAQLEKFLSVRQKATANAGDSIREPGLEQLRRDYPGVDIDAALRALEQMRVEGAK